MHEQYVTTSTSYRFDERPLIDKDSLGPRQIMSEWTKLGLVLQPAGGEQSRTHAMLPSPLLIEGAIRVYFASCDQELRGRIFSVDIDSSDPTRIRDTRFEPVLDLGESGAFDADGVNPSQLVERNGELFLYYIGWQRCSTNIPYTLFTGLAVSSDAGRRFTRISTDPILPPIDGESYFRTAPCVRRTDGGWEMLYIGGQTFFTSRSGKRLPIYGLRRTFSKDGITWEQSTESVLSPDRALGEIGFGRPSLWRNARGVPCLLISVRTESGYTLCETTTFPGWQTSRQFIEVLPRSETGWDSEMVCFGAPCKVDEYDYLFYNGNGFGRTGFGVARRRSPPPIEPDSFRNA